MTLLRTALKNKNSFEVILDNSTDQSSSDSFEVIPDNNTDHSSSEEETKEESKKKKEEGDSLHDKVQAEHMKEIERKKEGEENFASSLQKF